MASRRIIAAFNHRCHTHNKGVMHILDMSRFLFNFFFQPLVIIVFFCIIDKKELITAPLFPFIQVTDINVIYALAVCAPAYMLIVLYPVKHILIKIIGPLYKCIIKHPVIFYTRIYSYPCNLRYDFTGNLVTSQVIKSVINGYKSCVSLTCQSFHTCIHHIVKADFSDDNNIDYKRNIIQKGDYLNIMIISLSYQQASNTQQKRNKQQGKKRCRHIYPSIIRIYYNRNTCKQINYQYKIEQRVKYSVLFCKYNNSVLNRIADALIIQRVFPGCHDQSVQKHRQKNHCRFNPFSHIGTAQSYHCKEQKHGQECSAKIDYLLRYKRLFKIPGHLKEHISHAAYIYNNKYERKVYIKPFSPIPCKNKG